MTWGDLGMTREQAVLGGLTRGCSKMKPNSNGGVAGAAIKTAVLWLFSRVLRDSIRHYVGRSVCRSVCRSVGRSRVSFSLIFSVIKSLQSVIKSIQSVIKSIQVIIK